MNGESNTEPNTLPSVKQIVNRNLLYDSGNSNWGSVKTLERWAGTGGGREVQESGDTSFSIFEAASQGSQLIPKFIPASS